MLLAKPQGGFRPIALLPSLYRAHTKVRISHVRAWAARSARPYFARGEGKSTLDVGARTMIYPGAHQGSLSEAVLTPLIDVSKCFDR
eukprot:6709675-Pyramimonas_sp.AAC.1